MRKHIDELDFLKCIFILLMIVFHLVYIGDKYPYAKALVYTFHMPAFLIISGYLMNVEKSTRSFLLAMFWIFVPYALMESGYVVMSSVLPVREGVEHLTWSVWLDKLFLHPLGPYWYLHTLLICGLTYFAVFRLLAQRQQPLPLLILLGVLYAFEAKGLNLLNLANAFYFLAGVALRRTSNLDRSLLSGAMLTYLAISLSLALYRCLPSSVVRLANHIGANTFILLVFSPIFTMLVKPLVPVFAFDPSGMAFMLVALSVTVAGCFAIAWLMDKLHLSSFFWGKRKMIR